MPPAIPVLVCRNCQDLRELMASHAGEVVATKQMMKEQVPKRDVEIEALKQILAKRKHTSTGTSTGSTKFSTKSKTKKTIAKTKPNTKPKTKKPAILVQYCRNCEDLQELVTAQIRETKYIE